ncbi:MAG: amidohydrolase family protein [Candidatus Poribacteria bacterium]|nr:amidohydrolase family protein [Candidatus Poribacteria bacterium]MDP6746289.1 amidohydrolase family protein [Candidatus Poribacteria bacterium]MDP6995833.1 amidohydrolase family protein [Candidatus Poribacteria bacterium]
MRIDSHVHVWTLGAPPYAHNDDMSTQRPESPGLVESLIRYMDLNQIDRTVLIQCMYHGYDNSYLCHCLRRFPDRLHGVALLDPRQPDAAEKLERLYRQHGVQGMRLYPIRDEDASWLSSSGQNSLWQTARQLRIPFTWFGYSRQIPLLEPILQRFPEVKVIIDHLGEPRLSEGLDGDFSLLLQAARHPNLYVKATRIDGISDQPWPHQDVHPYIKAVFEAFGPQRMLGCTGFPENPQRGEAVGFRVIEEGLDFLSAEDKSWLLGKTADALYGRSSD